VDEPITPSGHGRRWERIALRFLTDQSLRLLSSDRICTRAGIWNFAPALQVRILAVFAVSGSSGELVKPYSTASFQRVTTVLNVKTVSVFRIPYAETRPLLWADLHLSALSWNSCLAL
jgi:hypothetical protein